MNTNVKTAGASASKSAQGFYRVAIVGAGSLKGKEVAEILDQRNEPVHRSSIGEGLLRF